MVSIEDSVKLEPGLAVTMLRGLALPNDMQKVPEDHQSSLIHASAYLAQVRPSLTCFDSVLVNFLKLISFCLAGWAGFAPRV